MTWFGGFQCYYSSQMCGLTCEAWGWGRSSRSCYESWCETTVDHAWSKREVEVERGEQRESIRKRKWCITWVKGRSERKKKRIDARNVESTCESHPEYLSCSNVSAQHTLSLALPSTSHYCFVGSPWVLTAVLGVLWRQSGGKGVCV